MRILHTPTNAGAHPMGLSLAERELGLRSEVVTFDPNPFGFEVDRSLFREGAPLWRTVPERLSLLLEAVRHYDVFHFNFGSTLLPGWGHLVAVDELPLLRRLGKLVIATFQGDDARPPDHGQRRRPPSAGGESNCAAAMDASGCSAMPTGSSISTPTCVIGCPAPPSALMRASIPVR